MTYSNELQKSESYESPDQARDQAEDSLEAYAELALESPDSFPSTEDALEYINH